MGACRNVGIDLGKETYEMKIIGTDGKVSGTNGRTNNAGRESLYKKLLPSDRVAIEVCALGMVMAKEIKEKVGCEVALLNPSQVALIYRSVKKNDKEDALKLARLVQRYPTEELPAVELPTEHEENLRQTLTELRQLKKDRTRAINRLHATFVECGITDIKKKDLGSGENREESIKVLKGIALAQARRALKMIALIEEQIEEVEKVLDEEIAGDENVERLMSVPGVGKQLASAYTAYLGDGSRYHSASSIGAAVGLVPRLDMSSKVCRLGHITKHGNSGLRSLLILAAWSYERSRNGGALKDKFIHMTDVQSKGRKVAIVAVARKLAEMMYSMLRNGTSYEKRTSVPVSNLAEEALAS